jgi:hypothetical protein
MLERKIWRRKREMPRAAARLWVRLHGAGRVLQASTLDLSRTGARIRLKIEDLGIPRNIGLFEFGKQLMTLLGEVLSAELKHPKSQQPVVKGIRLVRIGDVKRTAGDLDVGVRFEADLSDDELRVLGLLTPPPADAGPASA